MPILAEPTSETVAESPQSAETPATRDAENQTLGTGAGVSNIGRRWKREDLLKRGSLSLRGFGLLAFIIMASNKYGDWKEFDKYEEYRYVILSSLYTGLQILRQIHEISTEMFSPKNLLTVDFFRDQIVAYLLISAASSSVPLTNRMRGQDKIFTDSSASAISMEFFAFISLVLSAMILFWDINSLTNPLSDKLLFL